MTFSLRAAAAARALMIADSVPERHPPEMACSRRCRPKTASLANHYNPGAASCQAVRAAFECDRKG
jgi:hypothetical protein